MTAFTVIAAGAAGALVGGLVVALRFAAALRRGRR
jgi:hypothetical protein